MNTRPLSANSCVAPVSPDWAVVLALIAVATLMLLVLTGDSGGALGRLFDGSRDFVPAYTT